MSTKTRANVQWHVQAREDMCKSEGARKRAKKLFKVTAAPKQPSMRTMTSKSTLQPARVAQNHH